MKIALITDTHYGARLDNPIFYEHFGRFFREIFFPEIKRQGVTTVIHLGDLVDKKKNINFETLKHLRNDFLDPLKDYDVHAIVGNHDIYHKNISSTNALRELMSEYGYKIYESATTITLSDGTNALLIPWINASNYEQTMEAIEHGRSPLVFGHLEIEGCQMGLGHVCLDGMKRQIFKNFEMVMTGHFHHKHSVENIHYLGSPYDWTWADYNDTKGFHIFDTETRDLAFTPNHFTIFARVEYDDDGKMSLESINEFNYEQFRGKFVRLVVYEKNQPYWYDLFKSNLNEVAADVKVTEAKYSLLHDKYEPSQQKFHVEDTLKIVSKIIEEDEVLEVPQKEKLNKLFANLYLQAINITI